MSTYVFEKPLIRGTMLKRKSQFTALVDIAGEELIAHIPTTNRIGDVENKNLPCLLSYHDEPKMHGRILTPDGLRVVCAGLDNDPEKIGKHMLEMLAKFRNEGIVE